MENLDVEYQQECLYDYVMLKSATRNEVDDSLKWCGTFDDDMQRFRFASIGNEVELSFHSDYSGSGSGFLAHWKAVDVAMCPVQTLTAREGFITSPNYPNFLLSQLDCTITILAPSGKRVWIEFLDFDLGKPVKLASKEEAIDVDDTLLLLELGNESPTFRPFETYGLVTDGAYVSEAEQLQIILRTGYNPIGTGFRAIYKIIGVVKEERVITLSNTSEGHLFHLNYPNQPADNVDFIQHFVAPLGCVIVLELYHVVMSETACNNEVRGIEVIDSYADVNGTHWYMCYKRSNSKDLVIPQNPISLISYLNELHIRQKHHHGMILNATLRIQRDHDYKGKLIHLKETTPGFCKPNPCLNGAKCVVNNAREPFCQCLGYYTGKTEII